MTGFSGHSDDVAGSSFFVLIFSGDGKVERVSSWL